MATQLTSTNRQNGRLTLTSSNGVCSKACVSGAIIIVSIGDGQ